MGPHCDQCRATCEQAFKSKAAPACGQPANLSLTTSHDGKTAPLWHYNINWLSMIKYIDSDGNTCVNNVEWLENSLTPQHTRDSPKTNNECYEVAVPMAHTVENEARETHGVSWKWVVAPKSVRCEGPCPERTHTHTHTDTRTITHPSPAFPGCMHAAKKSAPARSPLTHARAHTFAPRTRAPYRPQKYALTRTHARDHVSNV